MTGEQSTGDVLVTHASAHTHPHTHARTPTHPPPTHAGLTEVGRVVVGGTVKAQVLLVRDEVRDSTLVYALALTEDVELEERRHKHTSYPHCNTVSE